jgi:hypothetical protein
MSKSQSHSFDFTRVPYDVLQWELNRFLSVTDRASFNTVMQQPERIHKRFAKDFAEKHAVNVALRHQRSHVKKINYMAENEDVLGRQGVMQAVEIIGKYADFLVKPIAVPLFKYRTHTKEKALKDLETISGDDYVFSEYMTTEVKEKLLHAMAVIGSIATEKHVQIRSAK